jgi:maltose O-acetyltransferase
MKTEKQKMLAGELYKGSDAELEIDRNHAAVVLRAYNFSTGLPTAAVETDFRNLFATFGENSIVRAPFFCDYGANISIGNRVFLNFNCVILDVGRVTIGDECRIGPAVQIYAADHPRDPALRLQDLESARSVTIGRNVWIGGGAILLPGITIGDHAIIGAGSVVTRDVAAHATVAGNPARALQLSAKK